MDKLPLAVLIDGENVAASHMPAIMQHAKRLGEPLARCVVGDFYGNRLSAWAEIAPEYALQTVFQKSAGKGSNSADIALTICAMDLLAERRFSRFLIVSSDCDFAPLAIRLGCAGVAVYGMGGEKSGSAWRAACTEFFVLAGTEVAAKPSDAPTHLPAPKKIAAPAKPVRGAEDFDAVRNILGKVAPADAPWVKLSLLGQHVRAHSKALGERLGNGRLLKSLRIQHPHVELRGKGQAIEVRLRRPRPPKQSAAPPTAPRPSPSEVHHTA